MAWTLTSLHGGTLRRALRSAFVLDAREPTSASRPVGASASQLLIAALAAGSPSLGVPGAIGAMSVGFASHNELNTRAGSGRRPSASLLASTHTNPVAPNLRSASVFRPEVPGARKNRQLGTTAGSCDRCPRPLLVRGTNGKRRMNRRIPDPLYVTHRKNVCYPSKNRGRSADRRAFAFVDPAVAPAR